RARHRDRAERLREGRGSRGSARGASARAPGRPRGARRGSGLAARALAAPPRAPAESGAGSRAVGVARVQAAVRWRRALAGAALSSALGGCTNVTRFGIGPVAAYPDDGKASLGDELRLRRGIGSSDFDAIGIGEYELRALVTERSQSG